MFSDDFIDESKFDKVTEGVVQFGDWLARDDGTAELVSEDTISGLLEGLKIPTMIDKGEIWFVFRAKLVEVVE